MCAGKYFAEFELSPELTHLWKYLRNQYQLDAFNQSCPADQDIINHYKQQQVSYNFLCYFFSKVLKSSHKIPSLITPFGWVFRARAHWPLCLATGDRVFVADPSTLGRHVAATAKFPILLSGCHMPHEQSLVWSLPNAKRSHKNALSVAGTSHSLSHTWATNCSVLAKAWK